MKLRRCDARAGSQDDVADNGCAEVYFAMLSNILQQGELTVDPSTQVRAHCCQCMKPRHHACHLPLLRRCALTPTSRLLLMLSLST